MTERPVQLLVTVLPVLSAGLYLLGLSYHQGYLAAYGIDDSLFPLAADRALFAGLFALVDVSFPAVAYALLALFLFVLAVLIAAILSSSSRVQAVAARLLRRVSRWRPKLPPSPSTAALLDRTVLVYFYASGLLVLILILLLMAAVSGVRGREQAEREILVFRAGLGPSAVATGDGASLPDRTRLVICGEHWCSFWSGARSITVRRDAMRQMELTPVPRVAPQAASAPAAR